MTVDVFSDIACPWCSIGEAHLSAALAAQPGAVVRWRPFQLQPGLPAGGAPRDAFFEAKFGGRDRMEAAFAHVAAAGRDAGVPFDFARLAGAPNTLDAHRVVLLGEAHGRALPVARALFDAYFAGGADVTDADVLVGIADAAGLPADETRAMLASDRFRDEVEESQRLAARIGVTGVPFVVVDGRVGVSGAQPPAALAQAFAEAGRLRLAG